MGRFVLSILVLAACAGPASDLQIDRVDPGSGPSTKVTPVRIEGSFHLPIRSDVDEGSTTVGDMAVSVGDVALADAVWRGEQLIEASVPAGLPDGRYDVTVRLGDRTDVLEGGFVVGTVPVGGARARRIDVTGSKVIGGPHADFPVLVHLADPELRDATSGGMVANAAGYDIAFSADAAGTVPLAHEVERYLGASGELVAWVKLPMLTTTTSFYIHYGDPNITTSQENRPAVWSAGYAAVWHLSDLADATGQNPGTNTGTGTAAGQIVDARTFNGAGTTSITVAASASIDDLWAAGGTSEVWFFATSSGQNALARVLDKSVDGTAMCDANVTNSYLFGQVFSTQSGNWCTPANSVPLNTWIHAVVVYNNTSAANVPTIYINGTARAVTAISAPAGTRVSDAGAGLMFGDRATGARAFAGRIDEVHLSRVPRTAGWIQTTYGNQLDPGAFCVLAP